jgi:hypothetical protein
MAGLADTFPESLPAFHVDASDDLAAFDAVTRQFLAVGRAVTAQTIL